jgi:hypothetical protein
VPEEYQVGDIVQIGDTVMVVLGWEASSCNEFTKPDAGKQFVLVDMLLVNQGESSTSISSMLQMSLKDETDQRYTVDFGASMVSERDSPDGELAPGERVRGTVGFQVPKEADELTFVFDADVFGSGKVFVALPAEPVSMEPPSELVGETTLVAYAVGDVIEISDMVFVVLGWDSPSGDEFNAPDAGKRFVVVDVLLVNQGSTGTTVSSMAQMWLKDETGQKYSPDLSASVAADRDSPEGEILPGERVRGAVGFQVPEDAGVLTFVFDAEMFGLGKLFVGLPLEPIVLEPPAELGGETEQATYEVGELVEIANAVIAVLGWESPPGDEFSSPDPGKRFVVVDVLVVNKGQSSSGISTMMQMSLKDETGQRYTIDLFASDAAGRAGPDGELLPGERVRGAVGFQVPEDAGTLTFVFDAEVFDYGKVFVTLPEEPISLAPPSQVPGEMPMTVHQVGEEVAKGTVVLTVHAVSYPEGDMFTQPADGNQFLVVDLTIENKGSSAVDFSSLLQMTLKDPTGQRYIVDLGATSAGDGTPPEGELSAGEKVRGQVGYEVPVDGGPFVFVFDAEVFGAGKVFVQLP